MTPYEKAGFNELTLFRVVGKFKPSYGEIVWVREDDGTHNPMFSSVVDAHQCFSIGNHHEPFIKELPKDADGFYLWEGGDMPVPGDWEVQGKYPNGGTDSDAAVNWNWSSDCRLPIIAFKPISRPDMPEAKPGPGTEPLVLKEPGPPTPGILTKARELQALLPEGAEIRITKSAIEYSESNK